MKDLILWHVPTHKTMGMFEVIRLKDGRNDERLPPWVALINEKLEMVIKRAA